MGILLYEMLNGSRPWDGRNIADYQNNIKTKPLFFKVELSQ